MHEFARQKSQNMQTCTEKVSLFGVVKSWNECLQSLRSVTILCKNMHLHGNPGSIYHLLPNFLKTSYTIRASIFVDVPYWPPYSNVNLSSCVVPGSPQWFFYFGKKIVIAWTQEKTTTHGGTEPHHSSWQCKESRRYCHGHPPHSPDMSPCDYDFFPAKWKNHWEGLDTTQEMNLSMS